MATPSTNTILRSIGCILILSLPFITLLQNLGSNTLLDSYRHPTQYRFMKSSTLNLPELSERYLITEEPTSDTIREGDTILYQTLDGLHSGTVSALSNSQGTLFCVVSTGVTDHVIPSRDIIGRIQGSLDDNPWSLLALQIWDLTIHTLNPCAVLPL